VPAGASIVIAAALVHAGLPFAAALVFVLLAPAPGAVEVANIAHRRGGKGTLWFAATVVFAAVGLGVVAATAGAAFVADMRPPFPDFTSRLALFILAALALRAAFDRSLRGLLLAVFPSHDTASHTDPVPAPASEKQPEPG
jgi:hypothetical protein